MALQLCWNVAEGMRALGTAETERGETLYLALEDNPRRLRKRLRKMLNSAPPPENMTITTAWARLHEGGAEDLDAWLSEHTDARLVVIDTLAKIRKPVRGNAVYQEDYNAL